MLTYAQCKSKHIKDSVQNKAEKNETKDLGLREGMTAFAFDFYKDLSLENKGENVCFSPVSLNIALSMVYAGARGNTAQEMGKVLKFPLNLEVFYSEFESYYNNLLGFENDTNVEFNMANKIFVEKTYDLLESYKKDINRYFKGAFEEVDFRRWYNVVEKNINKWVEEMTREKIKDLLPEGTLDAMTRMVLVNALYIKSKWVHPFEKERNVEKDFYVDTKNKVRTTFMTQQIRGIKYVSTKEYAAIELPYTSKNLSLVIIKPHNSTADIIHTRVPSANVYYEILQRMKPEYVYMEIPKFKTESSFSLADLLKQKGMKSAFMSADFSGMSGRKDLEISEVIQKVFFEIDEKGTEAAAATAVVMRLTSSGPVDMDRPLPFIANSPFVFILKENISHTPLFIGQYVSP